uniref:Uncharacterized protein n=1 Tax=Trichogramma kaykai TaxID=54128 RepID=A0ABD2X4T7_9HYME
MRRTTPVHHAFYRKLTCTIYKLFQIYNRFDMNYADEVGFTHFHLACEWDCEYVVEKFLQLGQDPNCLVPKTGDSPLHLSLKCTNVKICELLLRNGADPNLANIDGSTPLHIIAQKFKSGDLARMLFELSKEKYQPLHIDARDKFGRTPLRCALAVAYRSDEKQTIEILIRNGADPNSTNQHGSTLLHIICRKYLNDNLPKTFFEVCDNMQLTLQVDGLNNLGQTPLQWAVANFSPRMVDLLLDHGADVSKFIFPTECYFGKSLSFRMCNSSFNPELRLASAALMIVERLENRGYELDQSGALTIVKFLDRLKIFNMSKHLRMPWYCYGGGYFASMLPYDVFRLQPTEATKRFKYEDYYEFSKSANIGKICVIQLCEKMSRRFFQRWALEFVMELTHYELPIICCEKIIAKLMNQDLIHICIAASGQSH